MAAVDGLIAAMGDALRAVRPADVLGWSRHGGYQPRRSSDTPDEKPLQMLRRASKPLAFDCPEWEAAIP